MSDSRVRRWLERVIAAMALIVLAVPFLFIAAAIAVSSPGPVLFRQTRIGARGRPFTLYKFRTMHHCAAGAAVTVGADSRVYPVGRWLRRLKLDELPQFWNLWRGDMSIIGPRPEVERMVRHYGDAERPTLDSRPGFASRSALVFADEPTLLARATDPEAYYIETLMPRKVAVDLAYERTRTPWTDLRLLIDLALFVVGYNPHADHSLLAGTPTRGDNGRTEISAEPLLGVESTMPQ